ncbi:unnamed protein product [Moneuplotes crassus]|uniref:PPM-type phosphatase domain-containing protein n=1 Tax=Euplotes crassus TaxID=5936 RepID=A0AAD1UGP6_EUPCR|nr:unnamed protein product [Moneuplotes crassus]
MFILINDSKQGCLKVFGVFDGHGPFGHKVSKYVQTKFLTEYIIQNDYLKPEMINTPERFEDIKRELINIFLDIQDELEAKNFPEGFEDDESISGTQNDNDMIRKISEESEEEKVPKEHHVNFKESSSMKSDKSSDKDIRTGNFIKDSNLFHHEENPFQHGDLSLSGSTCTLAFHINRRIIMAYVGDSYACVGCRGKRFKSGGTANIGQQKGKKAILLMPPEMDHTPKNMEEKIRIYNSSGEVRESAVDKKRRIYVRARMYPGLSISRSLGDALAHEIGVVSTPDIIEYNTGSDLFLVHGSGGLWDLLSAEEVAELATSYQENGSVDPIWTKVKDSCLNDGGTIDDVSLIVSYFNRS